MGMTKAEFDNLLWTMQSGDGYYCGWTAEEDKAFDEYLDILHKKAEAYDVLINGDNTFEPLMADLTGCYMTKHLVTKEKG